MKNKKGFRFKNINTLPQINKSDVKESLNSELKLSEELNNSEEFIGKNTKEIVNRLVKVVNKKIMTVNQKKGYLNELNRFLILGITDLNILNDYEEKLNKFEDDNTIDLKTFSTILSGLHDIYDRNTTARVAKMNIILTLLYVYQVEPHIIYQIDKPQLLQIIETKELWCKGRKFLPRKNVELLDYLLPYIDLVFEKNNVLAKTSRLLGELVNRDLFKIWNSLEIENMEGPITTAYFTIPMHYLLN